MRADASFKEGYANYYDLIYKDKDYEKEVDFLEEIFGTNKPRNILEVGCGTGNYTRILLERGYDVVGMDVSQDMLKIARSKCKCKLINGDVRYFSLNEKFDACIAMFTVMGYILEDSDIIKALKNVYRHLKIGGIFVFDVWNGLAVMRFLPEQRIKKVENDEIKIVRYAVPNLRAFDHICEVYYTLFVLDKKNNIFNEICEKHVIRFYFPQEIKHYLEDTGFEVLKICPFMDLNGKVDENVWNIAVVARKREDEN